MYRSSSPTPRPKISSAPPDLRLRCRPTPPPRPRPRPRPTMPCPLSIFLPFSALTIANSSCGRSNHGRSDRRDGALGGHTAPADSTATGAIHRGDRPVPADWTATGAMSRLPSRTLLIRRPPRQIYTSSYPQSPKC
jgi:hypothetical protein